MRARFFTTTEEPVRSRPSFMARGFVAGFVGDDAALSRSWAAARSAGSTVTNSMDD
jgi:hypothetical protein